MAMILTDLVLNVNPATHSNTLHYVISEAKTSCVVDCVGSNNSLSTSFAIRHPVLFPSGIVYVSKTATPSGIITNSLDLISFDPYIFKDAIKGNLLAMLAIVLADFYGRYDIPKDIDEFIDKSTRGPMDIYRRLSGFERANTMWPCEEISYTTTFKDTGTDPIVEINNQIADRLSDMLNNPKLWE